MSLKAIITEMCILIEDYKNAMFSLYDFDAHFDEMTIKGSFYYWLSQKLTRIDELKGQLELCYNFNTQANKIKSILIEHKSHFMLLEDSDGKHYEDKDGAMCFKQLLYLCSFLQADACLSYSDNSHGNHIFWKVQDEQDVLPHFEKERFDRDSYYLAKCGVLF